MMELYDILRSLVTNAFLVTLLFTLARPKCRPRTEYLVLALIVLTDFAANLYFYSRGDYTMLAKTDIVFFLLAGVASKPLFREKTMPWFFNCVTTINVTAAIVVVSYDLSGFFPYPHYANTVLRAHVRRNDLVFSRAAASALPACGGALGRLSRGGGGDRGQFRLVLYCE